MQGPFKEVVDSLIGGIVELFEQRRDQRRTGLVDVLDELVEAVDRCLDFLEGGGIRVDIKRFGGWARIGVFEPGGDSINCCNQLLGGHYGLLQALV